MDGPVDLCPHPHLSAKPKLTILSCDVVLCDDIVPFEGVSSGVLAVHGPLKKVL